MTFDRKGCSERLPPLHWAPNISMFNTKVLCTNSCDGLEVPRENKLKWSCWDVIFNSKLWYSLLFRLLLLFIPSSSNLSPHWPLASVTLYSMHYDTVGCKGCLFHCVQPPCSWYLNKYPQKELNYNTIDIFEYPAVNVVAFLWVRHERRVT